MAATAARHRWKWIALAAMLLAVFVGALIGAAVWRPGLRFQKVTVAAPAAASPGPPRLDYAAFDARVGRLMQGPDMVGLAVATVEHGKLRFIKGYGVTQAGSADPVTPDTVFRWASLSKAVASALIVKLSQEGRMSVDDPVRAFHTTLTLPGDASNVTVADVLSHRLGLPHNAWDDRLEAGADPKELRGLLGSIPAACPPGTCHAYQNVAFDTASEIVEQVAGQPYAEAARQRLFVPLGMTSASIGRAGLQSAPSWARPHRFHKTPTTVEDAYYRVPAAGGVNSSIRDLARWMQAQMGQAPQVLSADALETLHRPRVDTPPRGRRAPGAPTDDAYGLGWRTATFDGHHLIGHRGSVDGYVSLILFDPADQSGIVMLWNANTFRPARLEYEFFDALYGLPFTDRMGLDEGD